ncbi:MAG: DUF7793 family protein [Bacteroidia bacterium]
MKTEEIKTQSATVRLITTRIIENIIHDYATLEKENVSEIKAINKQLTDGLLYAVLVDSGMYTSISKEARELTASKEFSQNTVAKALLVHTLGHRIVGQFYLKINKPHINTKIFSDRGKAIEWLNVQLNKIK